MPRVEDIARLLESWFPPALAAEWDNVGLLVGDRQWPVERIMTCLTLTDATADEAVRERAGLIVSHHPLPFHPLRRITADEPAGRVLLKLLSAGAAVFSPHTAFDSATEGINGRLAAGLGLQGVAALEPHAAGGGTGRFGRLEPALSLAELAERLKRLLGIARVDVVGAPQAPLASVAVGCGSAGELLPLAIAAGCQAMVLGETTFHTCLAAEAAGVALILAGHFASERFAVEALAERLAAALPGTTVWASRDERDPLRSL